MIVVTKLFMKCHHNQCSTGKHCKSTKKLKTTFKEHNDKHTSCSAQLNITILAAEGNYFRLDTGIMVLVNLNHQHNHPIHAADALRFRSISQDTKETYYNLFKFRHSPASAHHEDETRQMLKVENPHVLADRSINPKVSDIYIMFN